MSTHPDHTYGDELGVISARLSNMIEALEAEVSSTVCGQCNLIHRDPIDKYRALETLRGMRERIAKFEGQEWAVTQLHQGQRGLHSR